MENLRNRRKVDLVTNDSKLKKLAMQPSFLNLKIFTEDLVAIERRVSEVKLNRPIYTGFTILDVSKTLMYNWHYNFVKKRYPQESKLLFTDTDSLVYQIETDDIFSDMPEDQDLFDFSDYPKEQEQQNELGIPILTLESLDRLLQPQYDDISEQDHQDLNLDDFLKNITLPTPDGMFIELF